MKQIKTTLVLFLAIAAMAAGIFGDRNLDERYQNTNVGPEAAIVTNIDEVAMTK